MDGGAEPAFSDEMQDASPSARPGHQ